MSATRPNSTNNAFQDLGIDPTNDFEFVRANYLALAKKWHPDRNPDRKAEATEKFQKISSAFDLIDTKEKLKIYYEASKNAPKSEARNTYAARRKRHEKAKQTSEAVAATTSPSNSTAEKKNAVAIEQKEEVSIFIPIPFVPTGYFKDNLNFIHLGALEKVSDDKLDRIRNIEYQQYTHSRGHSSSTAIQHSTTAHGITTESLNTAELQSPNIDPEEVTKVINHRLLECSYQVGLTKQQAEDLSDQHSHYYLQVIVELVVPVNRLDGFKSEAEVAGPAVLSARHGKYFWLAQNTTITLADIISIHIKNRYCLGTMRFLVNRSSFDRYLYWPYISRDREYIFFPTIPEEVEQEVPHYACENALEYMSKPILSVNEEIDPRIQVCHQQDGKVIKGKEHELYYYLNMCCFIIEDSILKGNFENLEACRAAYLLSQVNQTVFHNPILRSSLLVIAWVFAPAETQDIGQPLTEEQIQANSMREKIWDNLQNAILENAKSLATLSSPTLSLQKATPPQEGLLEFIDPGFEAMIKNRIYSQTGAGAKHLAARILKYTSIKKRLLEKVLADEKLVKTEAGTKILREEIVKLDTAWSAITAQKCATSNTSSSMLLTNDDQAKPLALTGNAGSSTAMILRNNNPLSAKQMDEKKLSFFDRLKTGDILGKTQKEILALRQMITDLPPESLTQEQLVNECRKKIENTLQQNNIPDHGTALATYFLYKLLNAENKNPVWQLEYLKISWILFVDAAENKEQLRILHDELIALEEKVESGNINKHQQENTTFNLDPDLEGYYYRITSKIHKEEIPQAVKNHITERKAEYDLLHSKKLTHVAMVKPRRNRANRINSDIFPPAPATPMSGSAEHTDQPNNRRLKE